MNGKWYSIAVLVAAAILLLSFSGCGHNQHLVSIAVLPQAFTYFAPAPPGAQQTPIPLTAYGTYIHPPATKNITNQVTWASDNTVVADVNSAGQLTDGTACGVANISASFFTDGGNKNGNVVVGIMNVTVDGPASQGCPQSGATHNLSVSVTGGANGVIVSSPAGINCGTTCSAPFGSGSSVALTATPNTNHTFGGWQSGCASVSGTTCNVTMNSDVIVTATFN